MPAIDMPLPALLEYSGRNPRPADHDAYWDRALREMRSVESRVELRPADFQVAFAECFHLTFTGTRGARVHAKYVRPRHQAGAGPAVLLFHGYSGSSPEWCDLLRWPAGGVCVAAMDCRGQGGRSEDVGGVKGSTWHGHIVRGLDSQSPDDLLFRQIFLDTAQLAGIVMGFSEVDPRRMGALGGSQGGALTLACAALEPRIRRAAPTYPFLCDYQRVWAMDLAKSAYDELAQFFRRHDPTHARAAHWWTTLGYIDIQHLMHRVEAQVLMGIGLMDAICPPSTQFAAYNKITSTKNTVIFPDFGHEALPGFNDQVYQFMLGL
jgi:cephalosporin-C deacetylase